MKKTSSVLNSFYTSYAMTKHMIGRCDDDCRREYAEARLAYEEEVLAGAIEQATLSPTEQSRILGALAALKEWIAEDDRLGAELDAMYSDFCDANPEYLANA